MSTRRKYKKIIEEMIKVDTTKLNSSIYHQIVNDLSNMLYTKLSKIIVFTKNPKISIEGNKLIIECQSYSNDMTAILKAFGFYRFDLSKGIITFQDYVLDFLVLLNVVVGDLNEITITNDTDYHNFDCLELSDQVFQLFNDNFVYNMLKNAKEGSNTYTKATNTVEFTEDYNGKHSKKILNSQSDELQYKEAISKFFSNYETVKHHFNHQIQNGIAECIIAKAHEKNIKNIKKNEENGVITLTLET